MTICAKIARFLYYYAAFLAHSCLIGPPQWLIDMHKCPTIRLPMIKHWAFVISGIIKFEAGDII